MEQTTFSTPTIHQLTWNKITRIHMNWITKKEVQVNQVQMTHALPKTRSN